MVLILAVLFIEEIESNLPSISPPFVSVKILNLFAERETLHVTLGRGMIIGVELMTGRL